MFCILFNNDFILFSSLFECNVIGLLDVFWLLMENDSYIGSEECCFISDIMVLVFFIEFVVLIN